MNTLILTQRYPKLTERFTAVTAEVQKVLVDLMPSAQHLYLWIGRKAPPNKPFEFYLEEFQEYSGYCERQCKRAIDQLIAVGLVEVVKMYWPGRRYMLAKYRNRIAPSVESPVENTKGYKQKRTKFPQPASESPKQSPKTPKNGGSLEIDQETPTPTHPADVSKKPDPEKEQRAKPKTEPETKATPQKASTVPPAWLETPTPTHPADEQRATTPSKEPTPQKANTVPPDWLERVLLQLKKLGVIISRRLVEELRNMSQGQIAQGLMMLKEGRGIRNPTGYFLSACRGTWGRENADEMQEISRRIEWLKRWQQEKRIVASMEQEDGLWVAVGTIDAFRWCRWEEAARLLGAS